LTLADLDTMGPVSRAGYNDWLKEQGFQLRETVNTAGKKKTKKPKTKPLEEASTT